MSDPLVLTLGSKGRGGDIWGGATFRFSAEHFVGTFVAISREKLEPK